MEEQEEASWKVSIRWLSPAVSGCDGAKVDSTSAIAIQSMETETAGAGDFSCCA